MRESNMHIPELMGILNLTEDSFSDGSLYLDGVKACLHAEKMLAQGARVIDLGAESTRPGALPVGPQIQLTRLIPVLAELKRKHPEALFSIDTQSSIVAWDTIAKGADIINDISALRHDSKMVAVLAAHPHVKVILMHMQGTPETMQQNPNYENVLAEIKAFFQERIEFCLKEGIKAENILLDPGIGFGKTLEHNLDILANLNYFRDLGCPLVLGASRKSFINMLIPSEPQQRLEGTLAAAVYACLDGVAYLRVHDVKEHASFLTIFKAISEKRKA